MSARCESLELASKPGVPRSAPLLSELTKLGPGGAIYRADRHYRANIRHYLTASHGELLRSSDRRGGDCILRNTPV